MSKKQKYRSYRTQNETKIKGAMRHTRVPELRTGGGATLPRNPSQCTSWPQTSRVLFFFFGVTSENKYIAYSDASGRGCVRSRVVVAVLAWALLQGQAALRAACLAL